MLSIQILYMCSKTLFAAMICNAESHTKLKSFYNFPKQCYVYFKISDFHFKDVQMGGDTTIAGIRRSARVSLNSKWLCIQIWTISLKLTIMVVSRVVVPALQTMQSGGPARQPYSGVNFSPPVYEFDYWSYLRILNEDL